jgi:hypothetical protein
LTAALLSTLAAAADSLGSTLLLSSVTICPLLFVVKLSLF